MNLCCANVFSKLFYEKKETTEYQKRLDDNSTVHSRDLPGDHMDTIDEEMKRRAKRARAARRELSIWKEMSRNYAL